MLSLVALVFMALSTGMIVFQIINKKIIDAAGTLPGMFDESAMKFAISAIIIAAPIYYITTWQINKNLLLGKLNKEAGVRRWLTYFILFVSSVVMIGWFIAIVYNFLDGELTLKFILKAATAIFIAAIIFSYYLYDIRREIAPGVKNNIVRIYFYGSLVLVAAALVSSFFFVESPLETRARKEDNAILERFDRIDNAINTYYSEQKKMPAVLEDLLKDKTFYLLKNEDITDPLTKAKFNYKVSGEKVYELCASFKTSNKNQTDSRYNYLYDRWPHDAGYQCLPRKARSEIKGVAPAEPVR